MKILLSFIVTILLSIGLSTAFVLQKPKNNIKSNNLFDGILIGHAQDPTNSTGCTVIIFDQDATAGVDVRGSAPGTRETDLLSPLNTVTKINALLLTGGSAFGLDSASGVMKCLEEDGRGFATSTIPVPIVPGAVIYDLAFKNASIRPDFAMGYKACRSAHAQNFNQGSIGAGTGATVGKMFGFKRAMKGGLGIASLTLANGLKVGALVIVNAFGNILNRTNGEIIAGARNDQCTQIVDFFYHLKENSLKKDHGLKDGQATTLGVVFTNSVFDKTQLTKVAQMAHDGFARSINPIHTPYDGDVIFAVSINGKQKYNIMEVGSLAAEVMSNAIENAIWNSIGNENFPSASQFWNSF